MNKRFFSRRIIISCVLVMIMLSACAAPAAPAPAAPPAAGAEGAADPGEASLGDPVRLVVGTTPAPAHPENQYIFRFRDIIDEKSGGNITVEVHDSAVLGDHLARLEGLRLGTIDGTLVSIGFLGGYNPLFNIFEMPYLFSCPAHQHEFYNVLAFEKVADVMLNYGFVLVGAMEMGARHITNNVRPILTPDDLAGMLIRVPETRASLDGLAAMGASPTPLAFSELYMALMQGQMDGQENPVSMIYAGRFYEVQSYLSLTGHQRIQQVFLLSESTWNRLTDEQRRMIREVEREANIYLQGVIEREESELLQRLADNGMQINEVDQAPFRERTLPLREEYISEFGELAREFFDLMDRAAR